MSWLTTLAPTTFRKMQKDSPWVKQCPAEEQKCKKVGTASGGLAVAALGRARAFRPDLGELGLERVVLFARALGHRLDRFEFFTPDEIEAPERAFGAGTDTVADFAAETMGKADRPRGKAREIGEEAIFGLHGRNMASRARPCKPL